MCVHVCIHVCVYVYVCMYVHVSVRVCVCVCVCVYVGMCLFICMLCMHVQAYIYLIYHTTTLDFTPLLPVLCYHRLLYYFTLMHLPIMSHFHGPPGVR